MKHLVLGFSIAVAMATASAQETAAANITPAAVVQGGAEESGHERIVVVGQRPGPGLWKVSKGDHVLWIFGRYDPLPVGLEWRSEEVERVLSQSQEFIGPPSSNASIGFFKGLTLLPHLMNIKKNPDGATLKDLLPADVHGRWLALKARYLGVNDAIERERPIFAIEQLNGAAMKKSGLSGDREVVRKLDALVAQYKLKRTSTTIKLDIDNLGKVVREVKKSSVNDVACFSDRIARLETDIEAMRVRANAWAKGDIAVIEKLGYPDMSGNCFDAIFGSAALKDVAALKDIGARMDAAWLGAVERALATNKSTFAVLNINGLLKPDGLMATLAAKGYTVDKPE